MANKVNPIPDGYSGVTPYLSIRGAAEAIEFYKNVFGATELMRMPGPNGTIGHAELKFRDAVVMLADEHPQMGFQSPNTLNGTPVLLSVYVEDVDSVVNKAVAAGARLTRPVENQFYGDRAGGIIDPFGHHWHIATHVEDVPEEEMKRRAKAQAEKHQS